MFTAQIKATESVTWNLRGLVQDTPPISNAGRQAGGPRLPAPSRGRVPLRPAGRLAGRGPCAFGRPRGVSPGGRGRCVGARRLVGFGFPSPAAGPRDLREEPKTLNLGTRMIWDPLQ